MNGCIYRTEGGKCKQFSIGGVMSFCYLDGTCDCQIPSNADRIRSMTDEELAKTMHDMTLISTEIELSTEWWEQWLKAPVEVDK